LGSGAVVDVAAVVDSVTRGVAIRVRVTAPRRVLRIGETVAGRISVATRPNALVVPAAALVPEGDGFKVFVVDAQRVAHARAVTVGGRTDAAAEIVAGLTAGERVVTVGAYGVDDGARIAP
jgi:membrane fusion protein (multidrug efflux system)